MDAFFNEADLARQPIVETQQPFYKDPEFNAAIERQIRAAWGEQHAITKSSGPCVAGRCHGVSMPIRIWFADEQVVGQTLQIRDKLIHVCVATLCSGAEGLHGIDVTDNLKTVGVQCLQSGSAGGGVFWCSKHERAHICSHLCPFTFVNSLGFKTCILSGQTVAQSMEFGYGQGVAIVSDALSQQRKAEMPRISGRKRGSTVLDQIIREPQGTRSGLEHADDFVAVDLDAPAEDLFADDAEGNSFGDGMAKTMHMAYTQAYATSYLIIFSKERYDLEEINNKQRYREACQKISQYVNERSKQGLPTDLTVCRQLEDFAFSKAKRHFPQLTMVVNGKSRLHAYYSALCMEFYVQLITQLSIMSGEQGSRKLASKTKQEIDRFLTFNAADVMPNVLDILHEGLKIRTHILVQAEPVLQSMFPESLTMDKLGFRQKMCTEVKKLLKRCVVFAVEAKRPIERLQTTHIDMNIIIRTEEPVLTLFIEARRKRLGMDV